MGKFVLKDILARIDKWKQLHDVVFGSMTVITAGQLDARLDRIVLNLRDVVLSGKIESKLIGDLDSIYYDQCLNNKSIPTGGFVGDKELFSRFVAFYPKFKEHVGLLGETDLDFVENTIIPFVESIKSQLDGELLKKGGVV